MIYNEAIRTAARLSANRSERKRSAMYEIAICDDDRTFAAGLKARLLDMMEKRNAPCRLSLFTDPEGLFDALERGASCDLVFLDILFGEEKGLRFARLLRERKWDADIVFVSSSPDFAVDSFASFPLNYLLKPVSDQRLAEVMDRFLKQHSPRMLCLTTAKGMLRVPVSDVLYFEIYSHTIIIHRQDGASSSWSGTLSALEKQLPADCFVRPHRSYVVNLGHIVRLDRASLTLSSGDAIPISKNAYLNVRLSLVRYDDARPSSH